MACETAYRHDIRCRYCGSNWMPKDGHTRGLAAIIAASTIAFEEIWTYWGARKGEKRNDLWVWTAVVEERDGSRWMDFKVGDRDEATFLRLLDRLPDAERYETDAYGVYGTLPVNKHAVEKYGAVNWNEGLHSMLRGKLNRLVRRTKGCAKSVDMLVNLLALVFCDKLKLKTTHTKNTSPASIFDFYTRKVYPIRRHRRFYAHCPAASALRALMFIGIGALAPQHFRTHLQPIIQITHGRRY